MPFREGLHWGGGARGTELVGLAIQIGYLKDVDFTIRLFAASQTVMAEMSLLSIAASTLV